MRIVQLIDSLETGGAERMAVNYANLLSDNIEFSGIIVTRKEGSLVSELSDKVPYCFLNKKKTVDIAALRKLYYFLKNNKIEVLHAHSTSFFSAVLVKIFLPKLKLIWHDHYGKSEFLHERKSAVLKISSYFFSGIIAVNQHLKKWAESQLNCKKVIYFPNFTPQQSSQIKGETVLLGTERKRILCLANLRAQKDHFLLLKVAQKLRATHPDWSFHLVGKDFEDAYSASIRTSIAQMKLQQTVYLYGSRNDSAAIIDQSDIGILTSSSEGLPVSLLEYGIHQLPVVVTAVGEIPMVIQNHKNGFLVQSGDADEFFNALVQLIDNPNLMNTFGSALYQTILNNYSEKAIINHYIEWIETN
jgi:glycosyltransferase involved in cell wall biosynthesis